MAARRSPALAHGVSATPSRHAGGPDEGCRASFRTPRSWTKPQFAFARQPADPHVHEAFRQRCPPLELGQRRRPVLCQILPHAACGLANLRVHPVVWKLPCEPCLPSRSTSRPPGMRSANERLRKPRHRRSHRAPRRSLWPSACALSAKNGRCGAPRRATTGDRYASVVTTKHGLRTRKPNAPHGAPPGRREMPEPGQTVPSLPLLWWGVRATLPCKPQPSEKPRCETEKAAPRAWPVRT